jgi:hypothetical protein
MLPISFQKSATAKQPALPFLGSGLGYLASKLRKNLSPLFTGVNNDDFDKKFSLAKTLTNIRNSGNATTHSSNTQLLNSLLKTLNVDSKIKPLQNSLLCLS